MRRILSIFALSVALALTIAACSGSDEPASTSAPAATATQAAATTAPTPVPAVKTASFTGLGNVLTDSAGRVLYIFDRDTAGVSNCTGGCLAAWPPLLVDTATVSAASGITARLETITRPEGRQVTANGLPLYYFAQDTATGDAKGAGRGGIWWVVNPDGSKNPTSLQPAPVPTPVPAVKTASFTGLGNVLTDSAGRVLYIFDRDTAGVSNCTGGCLAAWPPLLVDTATVNAASGITARLETITRPEGRQVTTNGLPLYYFAQDTATGDAKGAGRGGIWWVVNPDGSKNPTSLQPAPVPTPVPAVKTASFTGLGNVLTDSAGRVLYIFDRDTAGVSNCTGGCLAAWPPLLVDTATVNAASGITARLETITRPEGRQVTANGLPLYYFAQDTATGDAVGAGRGGIWWVVNPDGAKNPTSLQPAPTPAPTATPAPTVAPAGGVGTADAYSSNIAGFTLETFTIKAGTSVVWVNQDSAPHTATSGTPTSPDNKFDTSTLSLNDSSTPILFATAGTFPYFCAIHPSMLATLTVTP